MNEPVGRFRNMYILTPIYGKNLVSACIQIAEKIKNKSVHNFFRLTIAVLALLEDIANGRIQRERVFRDL